MTHEDDRIQALANLYRLWGESIDGAHYRLTVGKRGPARLLLARADEIAELFKEKEKSLHVTIYALL